MFPPRRIVVCFKSPTVFTRDTSRMIFLFTLFCCLTLTASAFQTGPSRSLQKHNFYSSPPANLPSTTTSTRSSWAACSRLPRVTTTRLNFMGSDGGLLGVGTPELFTILLVGYFVLGPSDLYKLTKEIGKFITNVRTLGTDLTKTFENNMESQLQLEELRKAQRELNDAFSFRRTINVDREEEAFATTVDSPREKSVQDMVEEKEKTGKKKIRVRRRKKETSAETEVPDLEMPMSASTTPTATDTGTEVSSSLTQEEIDAIDKEFDQYTSLDSPPSWYSEGSDTTESVTNETGESLSSSGVPSETSRFQQQLSGNWNDQILANEDKLSPLAKVMEMLAVLEEEKVAANKRLEEEFERRKKLDEEYYQKQRNILQDAAAQVQNEAYANDK